jgi:hypothetical protein
MLIFDKETKAMSIIAKDTGDFVVSIGNYLLADGDKAYFTVNRELEKPEPLIQKVVDTFIDNKAVIRLSTEDTDIPVGNYYYDVEVNTADGRVDTIMGPSKFKVMGGVKY